MATKITKRDVLNKIIAVCADDAVIVAYAKHEIELIDAKNEKRKASPKKPTKTQLEAEARKPLIIAELGEVGKTAKEIGDALGVSFQKVTPTLVELVNDKVARSEAVKGKNLYYLA